ncbi:MAG: hypothetical protein COT67_00400 [Candidatus Tagabacteria bacterium CG09_land_8_20_14_0_10_41_14]|uniref:Peptidase M16 n=2 Tax=Candidatus Tagaibacteriota TaxID=1817918 RepID=A0A2H0WP69_9BACT|nr:MAG: hypothetical protein COT67_00400 [Candidatus Tagabacteria bacterium CG09_land_8_20_14_0_10_41_14]PJE72819.1 MAG: hypothetical protein COV00_03240 [Candidatus Tagabacteria bacterium CG10_big_fil_rev_8_21_14_0_10_40_13]
MIKFQKKVLSNGLRVIVAPMENTQAVTLLVLVGVGSRYETKKISGISHFLEHLFFKGTKSRPKSGHVHRDLDKIGAIHNAFTSKETTGFWVKSSAKDFDTSLDIVSDILLESLFKKEEIEKERGVIIQEISMYEDEPMRKVWDVLESLTYGDHPIGWSIVGEKETVSSIRRSDIIAYKNKNYLSQNMVVVVAGAVDSFVAFEKIGNVFKKIKKGKNKRALKARISQKNPRVKIINKPSDQTHLAMAVRGYDMYDKKRHALNLLAVILGGNASSKLFDEIREKLGLAYYVFANSDQSTDCGYLGIGIGVSHDNSERAVKKTFEILRALKKEVLSQNELKFAKSFLRGQMALKMETTDEVAAFCASRELFYKKIEQPEDMLKKIEKVTGSDILKITRELFVPSRINISAIGFEEKVPSKESFYKKLFSRL